MNIVFMWPKSIVEDVIAGKGDGLGTSTLCHYFHSIMLC